MAGEFAITPIGSQGLATIRADFPGVFLTAGAFALLGVLRHKPEWLLVPVTLLGIAFFGRSASRSEAWVDPIVGMRVNLPLSRAVDLTMLADVGGFGIASDITVQAWPTFGLRLSDSIRAKVGYRLIVTRYATGSGLEQFEYDVLTHGPTVGLQFRL